MSHDRTLTAAAALALLTACSGGSAPGVELPIQRDPAGASERGAVGPEPAAGGPESTHGGKRGSASAGGDGTFTGTCVRCDTTYDCTSVDANGSSASGQIPLVSFAGNCYLGAPSGGTLISCDGTILQLTLTDDGGISDVTRLTWTPYGNDGFRVVGKGSTVTCAPPQ